MDVDSALATLIRDLGCRLGLEGLALDNDGFCALRIDDLDVDLQANPLDETLLLYSDLGVAPQSPHLLVAMLQGNLFWRGTFGATLAVSNDTPARAVLARAVPWRSVDAEGLAQAVEQFVNTAEDWRELLADRDQEAAPPPEDGPMPLCQCQFIRG